MKKLNQKRHLNRIGLVFLTVLLITGLFGMRQMIAPTPALAGIASFLMLQMKPNAREIVWMGRESNTITAVVSCRINMKENSGKVSVPARGPGYSTKKMET